MRRVLPSLLLAPLVGCASYAPDDSAFDALLSDDHVTVTAGAWWTFTPAEEDASPETGVVFYPGGLVDPRAYAAPLRELAEQDVLVALVPMPSNLAVFAPNAADDVLAAEEDVSHWIIAGHSLGGAMAAQYAADHADAVDGLALWAAYPPEAADLSTSGLAVTSVTASEDGVLDAEAFDDAKARLPADTVYVDIAGGNHAGFADYGPQEGDGEATLDRHVQHLQTLVAMLDLVATVDGSAAETDDTGTPAE